MRFPARFPPGSALEVPTLAIEELAAGKFTALVQRSAARDAFDAARLLDLMPALIERPEFRIAFLCFLAASRNDARELRSSVPLLQPRSLEREVEPLLRRGPGGETQDRDELADWIEGMVTPAIEPLLAWSPGERCFLDRLLDHGEIDAAALHADPDVQERIRRQPMLKWKARHVRSHKGES